METTLVKKLKATVSNNSLPRLGEIELIVSNANDTPIHILYADSPEVLTDKLLLPQGLTIDSYTTQYPKFTGSGVLRVKDKYNIQQLGIYTSNFVIDDIRGLKYSSLETLQINSPAFLGNNDFAELSELPTTLKILDFDGANLIGSFSAIKHLVNLEQINLSGNNVPVSMTELATKFPQLISLQKLINAPFTGSIEDFVTVRRGQGKTTGSVYTTYGMYSNITFNGSVLDGGADTPFSWTATTITYNGVTINA